MKNIDILRKLGARSPDVLEQVIALWGEAGLFAYIHNLPRHLPPSSMDQLGDLLSITEELRQAHLEEFPAIPCEPAPEELEIRATEQFPIINQRFPHIGRRMIQTWGSYAFYMYAGTLFTDTRGGSRRGFPPEILLAITRIVKVHELAYPRLDPRRVDIWADVFHERDKF
jgi:hypothetical protein